MKRLLAVFLILVLLGSIADAASRVWKSSNGRFSVEADLLDFKDGKAQLRKSNGTVIEVPLVSLCEEDRRYVKSQFPGVEEEKLAPGTEYRDWKTKNGKFGTVAEFLGCEEGKVRLRKLDGSEISVDKKLLSAADQRWIADELRRQGEEEKEDKSSEKSEEEVVGKIDETEIPMKLVRLDLPKAKRRGRTPAASPTNSYFLSQITPQQFVLNLGKNEDSRDAEFHRVIKHEPSYSSSTPIRGVARFGSQEFGFAFDSVGGRSPAYNRLYFDLNGNGDLTDDRPIAAITATSVGPSMSQSQFPRVNITLEVKGQSIDYSFLPSLLCQQTGGDSYATATFYAAAYREGYITQGKRRIRLVLLDHNSNGLYDDEAVFRPDGGVVGGDMLLINPNLRKPPSSGDLGSDRNFISKTVCIGREFYRMQVSPSGDSLKLTPTKFAMGCVVNSSPAYRAVLFNPDYGVVAIGGSKDEKIALPEGTWKVLSYTIIGGSAKNLLAATFAGKSPETTVKKGETAKLPFGPPLRAVVTAGRGQGNNVSLSLAIVGVSGEHCTNLLVNGTRPPKPQLVIKDKDGKVVHQGNFEYG
ncbi:MAG: SHD1 domain-containing protein [Thermoguttaceae bacterium]